MMRCAGELCRAQSIYTELTPLAQVVAARRPATTAKAGPRLPGVGVEEPCRAPGRLTTGPLSRRGTVLTDVLTAPEKQVAVKVLVPFLCACGVRTPKIVETSRMSLVFFSTAHASVIYDCSTVITGESPPQQLIELTIAISWPQV